MNAKTTQSKGLTILDPEALGDSYRIVDSNGNFYAKTYASDTARLIAAGPDLLAAAKKAEDYLRNHVFRTGTGTKEDRIFADLVAAIAKAAA